jgi:hypothetical protein
MTIRIALSRRVGAPREFVFDWWTDLQSTDTELVEPLKKRTMISRSSNLLVLRDEEQMYWKKMVFDVRVTLSRPESWVAEYSGDAATARSEYRLSALDGDTTLLSYQSSIEPSGVLTRAFAPVVAPFIKRIFASEMDTFNATLEREFIASRREA